MEKRFRRLPDNIYFFGLLPALSVLPPTLAARLIRLAGRRLQSSLRSHAELIRLNLNRAGFGQPGAIARSFFEVMAAEDLDAFYFKGWNEANVDRYFSFEGLHHLQQALDARRGAILLTGHLGCVCSALVALAVKRFPVTHVSRGYPTETSLPSAFLRYALKKVSWMEEKMGHPLIYAPAGNDPMGSGAASLEILAALRTNKLVSMAIDVIPDMAPQRSTAQFLGKSCTFPTNFLKIAYASGGPVLPYFTVRETTPWNRQRLTIENPIALTGNLDRDLQACVNQFEKVVTKFPEQWFSWDALTLFESKATNCASPRE